MTIVAFFIIVACAGTIAAVQPRDIASATDAALALRPFGPYAYLLFSLGLFNASLFAACIQPLSTSYVVCEGLGFESGVNFRFREAPIFYWLFTLLVVIGAGVVLLPGFPLVRAILWSQIINGILWILRTGAPWRDLPERYGPWATVASRFYSWRKSGLWDRIFAQVQIQADAAGQIDWHVHYVDGTIVRAHQHAAGAKGGTRRQKHSATAKAASRPRSTSAPKATAS
jgi:transposase